MNHLNGRHTSAPLVSLLYVILFSEKKTNEDKSNDEHYSRQKMAVLLTVIVIPKIQE